MLYAKANSQSRGWHADNLRRRVLDGQGRLICRAAKVFAPELSEDEISDNVLILAAADQLQKLLADSYRVLRLLSRTTLVDGFPAPEFRAAGQAMKLMIQIRTLLESLPAKREEQSICYNGVVAS